MPKGLLVLSARGSLGKPCSRSGQTDQPFFSLSNRQEASVLMQRLSYPSETVLSNKITRNRIVLTFKVRPRKPLRRRTWFWVSEPTELRTGATVRVIDFLLTCIWASSLASSRRIRNDRCQSIGRPAID